MKGYVYLIYDESNNVYKIGVTRNSNNKRISALQTGNSTKLNVLYLYETNYPFKLESILHNRYKIYNVLNEWFDLPKEDVENFIEICNKIIKNIEALKDNQFFVGKGLK